MGLQIDTGILDIMKEGLKCSFKDKSILMLGKQDMYITIDELFNIARSINYNLSDMEEVKVDQNGKIDSYSFFLLLGFKEVQALDVSAYENATIVFDLNNNSMPEKLLNRFDYIFDGGTFEHLFNISNAFENVIKMLKVGGKIFHYVPANNYIDHGFYSISPVLFIEYYEANNFFIEDVSLIYCMKDSVNSFTNKVDCRLFESELQYRSEVPKDTLVLLQCIVTKKNESTYGKLPIQKKFFKVQQMYEKAKKTLNEIKDNYPEKSIAIYGTGNMSQRIIEYLRELQDGSIDKIFGLIDRDEEKIGKSRYGYNIYDINEFPNGSVKAIIIVSSTNEQEIYYRINYLKNSGIDIIKLIN